MSLTTFEAIMGFAADMFRSGEEILRAAAQNAKDLALRDLPQELAADQRKNELPRRKRTGYPGELLFGSPQAAGN